MNDPQNTLRQAFAAAIEASFGPEFADTDPLIRPSQNPQFGDYQANVAMSLAKRVGAKPREVAERLIEHLDVQGVCEVPEIAGPGFINLKFIDEYLSALAGDLAADERLGAPSLTGDAAETVVVDYSSPNVAKEMHVGHLRSTVIGDALCRILEFAGHTVIRQNHIGDWGTQFGMLIEHLIEQGGAEQADIADLNLFYQEAKKRDDADEDFSRRARERVVALQSGDEETNRLWRKLIELSKLHFNAAYDKLGVLLTDDDIQGESAYNDALPGVVEGLEAKGLIKPYEGAKCVFVPGFLNPEGEPQPLNIQKKDGGFGYAATDLAAIRYRTGELGASRLLYVVDSRQKAHFDQVYWTAREAGWLGEGDRAEHVMFGMILGEDKTPFKTRDGGTVKLADLLNEAFERASGIVGDKSPGLSDDERAEIARAVSVGAVKYADLSNDRIKDYVFSWDRMMSTEGNAAPYLQYAYARIRSIFRKVEGEFGASDLGAPVKVEHEAERALLLKLVQLPSVLDRVVESLEPHQLCTWVYELSSAFSTFYNHCPIMKAETAEQRASRLVLCDVTSRALKQGLGLLGIDVLERM
jgi:arginyl-tRNA synthetase